MQVKLGELLGKDVTTLSGVRLGTLSNVELASDTGNLNSLLVKPRPELEHLEVVCDSAGHLRLPFDTIRSVKDVVMVDFELPGAERT